jgi:hypothetical protein
MRNWKKPEPWISKTEKITIAEIAQKINVSQGLGYLLFV